MTIEGDLRVAQDMANRLYNAVIVLYGSAREMRFAEWEAEDAELLRRVIERAEQDMGPYLLRRVQEQIEKRAPTATRSDEA